MQLQDVKLIGHLNCFGLYVENIEDDKTWSLFLKTYAIDPEKAPKIDFTTRKVILVPTYEITKKRYIVYKETLRDHSKKCLEINFIPFEYDCAAKKILMNARMILELPKNEIFTLYIDAHQRTMAEKDKELVDRLFKQEKNLEQIRKVEAAQKLIKSFSKTDSSELRKVLVDLYMTKIEFNSDEKKVDKLVKTLRKNLLGRLLNK